MTDSTTEKVVSNNDVLILIAIFSRGRGLLAGAPGLAASNQVTDVLQCLQCLQ